MSARGRSVSTCAIIRTTRGIEPVDLELAGADQRHVAEAEPAGGVRRELRDQVGGRGEDHADEVVDLEAVGGHHVRAPSRRPARACARARRSSSWVAPRTARTATGTPPRRPTPVASSLRAGRRPAARRARRGSARAARPARARAAAPGRSRCGSAGAPGGRRASSSRRTIRLRPSWMTSSTIERSAVRRRRTFAAADLDRAVLERRRRRSSRCSVALVTTPSTSAT